ncbi:MAG: hypothetical protein ACRCX2_37270, partial [Paraclostridium sp.]
NDFNFIPTISLYSDQDLSDIGFSIFGYQNSSLITENLKGPKRGQTVYSKNCFDVLQSITPLETSLLTIQVGTGITGYLPLIKLNTENNNTSMINYALNMIAATINPPTYDLFLSLKDNIGQGNFNDLISNNIFVDQKITDNTSSQMLQLNELAKNLLVRITKNDNDSTLRFHFLQK